jgi:Flp pilus assembly secretin CpaC
MRSPSDRAGRGGSFDGDEAFVGIGGDASRFTRPETDRLQQHFVECGVTFPEGSFIRFNSRINRLFSRNTEENQALIKHLLFTWGILPYQVQLDLAYVAFEKSAVDELAKASATATPKAADLQALRRKGSGKTLAATTTITRSGVNAQLRAVDEILYLSDYETSQKGAEDPTVVSLSFNQRETGIIVNFTPTVSPDLELIDVTIVPELSEEPVWQQQEQSIDNRKQPQFRSKAISTSIIMRNGSTIVMGGMPSKDGKEITYAFITVTLIDEEGNPIRLYDFNRN